MTHDQVEAMTMADRIVVINEGRIQQVGAPQAVYESPANLFVATFIGSPPMNLISGKVSASAGGSVEVTTDAGTVTSTCSASLSKGADVVVGIRPEHLSLSETTSSGKGLRAKVENIELLGHERHVICSAAGSKIVFRQANDAAPVALGQEVTLDAEPDGTHLFDPTSTQRLN
ncbi:MAG: TOBE domain-containing protein [Microthrixaceae bacterium]